LSAGLREMPVDDLLQEASQLAIVTQDHRRGSGGKCDRCAVPPRESHLSPNAGGDRPQNHRIETDGEQIGQVNGLSVMTLGGLSFSEPDPHYRSHSARVAKCVDIEREVGS
jgi:hypothetical protein